ncbi:MAG: protein kinase [Acidobacteriota bacterium]|nr:protein kinase [Acidobacteriota bacterium]
MTPERWRKVKIIVHHALECDAPAREKFLQASCEGDRDLRSEVESLLILDGETGSVLDSPAVEVGAMAAAVLSRHVDPLIGRMIGNYVITGELASGGMGIVYRARHINLPRDVVVKCIRPLASSERARNELRVRFRREAHLQSQLDHPHIVRVYEFFDTAEEHFLVMEYAPGLSLRSLLDEKHVLPAADAITLAAQALDALEHAHTLRYEDETGNTGEGIIHRDIKPANMLIDEHGKLKLTDFGIAKGVGPQLTQTGLHPGTAGYMSPEQIRGLPMDARSDLYSVGITFYEMLSGCVPFPPVTSGSAYETFKAQIETDPPRITKINNAIPCALADIVARSLMKDPDQRWQTAREFRQALLSHQQNPAAAMVLFSGSAPLAGTEAKRAWARRRVTAAWVAGATLAAVTAVTGVVWLGSGGRNSRGIPDNSSIAVLPFADMSPDKNQEYFSAGLAEELLNGLSNTPGLRVVGRTSSFQFKGKTADFRVIGKKLNAATILEGSVRKQGNRARITVQLINAADGFHLWSETYERDMNDIFAVEEEIARAVTGTLKLKLLAKTAAHSANGGNADAYTAFLQGRYFLERRSKANLEKALGYFEQAVQIDPNFARAWVGLAEAHSGQAGAGYFPPEDAFRAARVAADRALALSPELADGYAAVGWIRQFHDADWAGADESYKKALALDPGNAIIISHAGILARILGHLDLAVALGRRAMRIDPLSPGNCHNAGIAMYYAGLQDEAAAAFRKALELSPEMEVAHCFLGLVYLARSRPREALAAMEQEKQAGLRLFGLALTYHALGQKKESDANLAELIRQFPTAGYQMAQVYAFRGQADRAFGLLEKEQQLAQLKGDPLLKNLRQDPRYYALLKKMRLPL